MACSQRSARTNRLLYDRLLSPGQAREKDSETRNKLTRIETISNLYRLQMSLAQRVTHVEGFDYEGPPNLSNCQDTDGEFGTNGLLCPVVTDDNKSEWRRLSFAPVDVTNDEPPPKQAAYRVSDAKRAGK